MNTLKIEVDITEIKTERLLTVYLGFLGQYIGSQMQKQDEAMFAPMNIIEPITENLRLIYLSRPDSNEKDLKELESEVAQTIAATFNVNFEEVKEKVKGIFGIVG